MAVGAALWKVALQDLAIMPIPVRHFPPDTSKWNKIEHRMLSHISSNRWGRPLISHEVINELIANATTKAGLRIPAELDTAPTIPQSSVSGSPSWPP